MRDTVLEAADGSQSRLAVESVGLVIGGLKARASGSAPANRRELIGDCCARVATAWGLVTFTMWLAQERWASTSGLFTGRNPAGLGTVALPLGSLLLFAVCLELIAFAIGFALVGYRRWGGLVGLAWVGLYLTRYLTMMTASQWSQFGLRSEVRLAAFFVVPIVCYVVMVIAPGDRPRMPGRLVWLLGAWLLGGIVVPPDAPLEPLTAVWYPNVLLMLIASLAVLSLTLDLWRSVALATTLLAVGLPAWTSGWSPPPELRSYVYVALTTIVPLALIAGATARLVSARRGLPG